MGIMGWKILRLVLIVAAFWAFVALAAKSHNAYCKTHHCGDRLGNDENYGDDY